MRSRRLYLLNFSNDIFNVQTLISYQSVLATTRSNASNHFEYLDSALHAPGDIDYDARIPAAWAKQRKMSGKMPVKLKGQVYKSNIRPVLLCGSETFPLLERYKQSLRYGIERTKNSRIRFLSVISQINCTSSTRLVRSTIYRQLTWGKMSCRWPKMCWLDVVSKSVDSHRYKRPCQMEEMM